MAMASLAQTFESLSSKLQMPFLAGVTSPAGTHYASEAGGAIEAADKDDMRQIAFTFSIIALAAKLANVEGRVSKQSYWAFREVFPMQATEDTKIRSLFLMAMNEQSDPEQYLRQIMRLFPARFALYKEIIHRLLKIASADAPLSAKECDYVKRLALKFGMTRQEWKEMLTQYSIPKTDNPYEVLGVSKKTSDEAIKMAHRRLVQENHPDRYAAQGASSDILEMLSSKTAAINAAYDEIRRSRKNKKGAL